MTPSFKTTLPASARHKSAVITKSDFVRFAECPLYAWLCKNRPDLMEDYVMSRIARQGQKVEDIALKLLEGKTELLYQPKAYTDKFYARADILKPSANGKAHHLYEVKSSTQVKKEHLPDLCFQYHVFTLAGYKLDSINLVLVNSDYTYDEKVGLEPDQFLKIVDMTTDIQALMPKYEGLIEQAYKILTSPEEPRVKALKKSLQYPPTEKFVEYYYRSVPDYSIYDILRITQKSLETLAGEGIIKITDIPDDWFNSDSQNLQVELTKQKTAFIDYEEIARELGALEYPLYFLDYETINPAVPLYNGMKPYRQIPFQYSLHVAESPESLKSGDLKHFEFLHTEKSNPVPHLLKTLKQNIGPTGNVVVWYKSFEKSRNSEMAEMMPEYAPFLEDVNNRVYDLMDIFKKDYVDYRFRGSASIKQILPVMAPDLSYTDLEIAEGGSASEAIFQITGINNDLAPDNTPPLTPDTRAQLITDLKKYCERDTLAMVEIMRALTLTIC